MMRTEAAMTDRPDTALDAKRMKLLHDRLKDLMPKIEENVSLASRLIRNEADLASELADITRIIAGAPHTTRH